MSLPSSRRAAAPFRSLVVAASLLLAPLRGQEVEVRFTQVPPRWTVRPGSDLEVRVHLACAEPLEVRAQWIHGDGRPASEPFPVSCNVATQLVREAVAPGYLGLVFSSADRSVAFPPQPAGVNSRAYGFAVLPERVEPRSADPSSPFGMVHGRGDDPYLGPHLKSLTWRTTGARWWRREMDERREQGMLELPLVSGEGWDTDGHEPVGLAALALLEERFRLYAEADPRVDAWELGVEENLRRRYEIEPHYFPNLRAKAERVRAIARAVQPRCQLVYNVEGFKYEQLEALLESGAFAPFDVLSSHPYRWKRFESPEDWLPAHLARLRALLEEHGLPDRPLWLTEIGLPVRGNNDPTGFFGYPKKDVAVPGVSPDYAAVYLVKAHLLALAGGVERIYWYNYQNRAGSIHEAEDHFGLRAFAENRGLGDPLPAYVAYARMVMALEGLELRGLHRPDPDVWLCELAGTGGQVLVAWTHPAASRVLPWSSLPGEPASRSSFVVSDLYGAPQARAEAGLVLDGRPRFVQRVAAVERGADRE